MINDNRRRLLDIMKLLFEKTDEEHWITTEQIRDELEQQGYERPNRKTIDPNIQFLIEEMGLDIEKERGTSNRYRWVGRDFELAELKLLVDAVQSSRFISDSRSREIISKLKSLTSDYQGEQLDRKVITANRFKRDNSSVLYSIDAINEGIRDRKKISFVMVDYDVDMNEQLRHDGRVHEVSPYALIWNNDYYYMLAMATGESIVKPFRVDRMKNTAVLATDADKQPVDFKLEKYSSRVFDMFGGEPAEISLECRPYIMNYLVDRFGKDFRVVDKREDGTFVADIVVEASPTFFSWVFQFGGDAKIIGPDKVKNDFAKMIEAFK